MRGEVEEKEKEEEEEEGFEGYWTCTVKTFA